MATIDDYHWLVGEEAARALDTIAGEPDSALVAVAARLRKEHSPARTHLLVEQATLRRRARAKFDDADRMFFTPLGLQQATDQRIARYKAEFLPKGATVADLCCGIGGDLLAMAENRSVVGIDRDPIAARFAEANLKAVRPESPSRVVCEEATPSSLNEIEAWHIDPDRRPAGHRTTQPELHEPSPGTIDRLLEACPNAMLKLAPAAEVPSHWASEGEREWITSRRECRQQVIHFGTLARRPGLRRATILLESSELKESEPIAHHTFTGSPDQSMPYAPDIKAYFYEPCPSVLAADLTAALAEQLDLAAPNISVPYLTSDQTVDDPLLARFEVETVMPFDFKRVKRALTERNVGRLEIKKRAVDLVPEALSKKLKLKGDEPGVLFLFPLGQHITAVLARRV
ncbi:MAG: class I SAM-dependent methyltransferase [Planctomycetia bacterium]|jgi:hypothetical protein